MRIFKSIFLNVASYASVVGVYLTVLPIGQDRPDWHWIVISLFGVLSAYSAYDDYMNFSQESHKTYSTTKKVNKFMNQWVQNEGRTVIFTRDMSWGEEFEIKPTLMRKARAKQLKIYLQSRTDLSDELQTAGADIVEYSAAAYEPKSRFTIVGAGKQGARVAVGTKRNGKHVVYKFESGDDPVFAIAEDLTEMLGKLC
ncbi:MAG: hypothetical protein VYE13_02755 [Pseudomonadota bacterium]|nr:hypothetical protein [Pseudomonadota bacterium]